MWSAWLRLPRIVHPGCVHRAESDITASLAAPSKRRRWRPQWIGIAVVVVDHEPHVALEQHPHHVVGVDQHAVTGLTAHPGHERCRVVEGIGAEAFREQPGLDHPALVGVPIDVDDADRLGLLRARRRQQRPSGRWRSRHRPARWAAVRGINAGQALSPNCSTVHAQSASNSASQNLS